MLTNRIFCEMILTISLLTTLLTVINGDNNSPSLISTNATLAVILDKEYLGNKYQTIKNAIETYLVYAKRELLLHGGVSVQYFSWTNIYIKKEFAAILSVASCADTWQLFRAAEASSLLHMAISEPNCPRLPPHQAVTVPLIIRGEELSQLILDLRTSETYKWKSAVVLYDDTLSRDDVNNIVKSLTAESVNIRTNTVAISLIKIRSEQSTAKIRQHLRGIFAKLAPERVGKNFLVIVSFEIVEIVMELAKSVKMVNTISQWLYVICNTDSRLKDISQFQTFLKEGDNVAFLYNYTLFSNASCIGGIECHTEDLLAGFIRGLDRAIVEETELASQVSDEEWEAIRPTKVERQMFLLENVKNYLYQSGKCDNCTTWLMETGDTWGLEYQSVQNQPRIIKVGKWRPSDGPSLSDELFPHIAHGFRQRNLPIITYHNPPWQVIEYNSSGVPAKFDGFIFDVVKQLAESLNFTYTVTVLEHNLDKNFTSSRGSVETNNITTNVIPTPILEVIEKKRVAFAACALTINERAYDNLNFSNPVNTQVYTFLVARPKVLSRALLFISPFTTGTWLCLAATIILMGPILYSVDHFSPIYAYNGISKKGGLSSMQNCIWYMYGALLQQGGMHLPQADSARVIVGAWWLVVLVVTTTYCGNLVAFLTFPKIDIPITTIDELIEHKETVTWSFRPGSFLETTLRDSYENNKYKEVYRGRIDITNYKEMVQKIENGQHVFIDWKLRLQYIMKNQYLVSDTCDLALGLDEFFNEQLGIVFPRDTPYLDIINMQLKKLHQVGLMEKWLKSYLPKRDRCWKSSKHIIEVSNHTVNLDDMQGSFFVLFFGFTVAVSIILGEKLWMRHVKIKRKKIIQPFIS